MDSIYSSSPLILVAYLDFLLLSIGVDESDELSSETMCRISYTSSCGATAYNPAS